MRFNGNCYKWKEEFEIEAGQTTPIPSNIEALNMELKILFPHLKYAYVGTNNTYPVIVYYSSITTKLEKLLRGSKEHKKHLLGVLQIAKSLALPSVCTTYLWRTVQTLHLTVKAYEPEMEGSSKERSAKAFAC